MKVAIMQPYFFPYIGYFQLISAVDVFVIYDNLKYTKKGWINRNRIISNGKELLFSIPLKKDSDYLKINERQISTDFDKEKFQRIISENYKKSENFDDIYMLVNKILSNNTNNLFDFIFNSILEVCSYLNLDTKVIKSSTLLVDRDFKGQEMVLAICKQLEAKTYINPIGGTELYSKEVFLENNIELFFLKAQAKEYQQHSNEFIPFLSIIDLLMMNSREKIIEMINCDYELISNPNV